MWRERMAGYAASGLTQKQWCVENSVPAHQFNYWRRRLTAREAGIEDVLGTPTAWCQLQVAPEAGEPGLTVRVGAAQIEVRPGFDADLLRSVVQALEGTGARHAFAAGQHAGLPGVRRYEDRGVKHEEAERRAWATVNAMTGGGKKSGSGRGKGVNKAPAEKGGHKGGEASANRSAAERSASAKKAAATRKRNAEAKKG